LLNNLILEATLKYVADPLVTLVPPLGIPAVQPSKRFRQVRPGRSKRRVVVVGHSAVVHALNVVVLDDIPEQVHELSVVHFVQKDGHAPVSSSHDVSNQAWDLDPFWTCHVISQIHEAGHDEDRKNCV
jgi:hypothetical protein